MSSIIHFRNAAGQPAGPGDPISLSQAEAALNNLDGDTSATNVTPTGAAVSRTLAAKAGDHPTVFDFFLASDSTSDYGPAINRCWAAGYGCDVPTFLPCATPLIVPSPGLRLFGRGRTVSGLSVPASALAALNAAGGLITATGQAIGPEINDIGITYQQPTSGTAWVQYPPTLLLTSTPRTRLRSVRIALGWGGIKSTGSVSAGGGGGLTTQDLEISCLGTNVALDQCFDAVRFTNPHIWPFGVLSDSGAPLHPNATNLLAQFENNAIGYLIGRVDDLDVIAGLTFMVNALTLMPGADMNGTFGDFTAHDFDNFGGVDLDACLVSFNACKLTLGTTASQCVIANNGAVHTNFNGCTLLVAAVPAGTSGNSALQIGAGSQVAITGGRLQLSVDATGILAAGAGTDLTVSGLAVERVASGNYLLPAILVETGARPTITGCSHTVMPAHSTGVSGASTIFVAVTQDVAGCVGLNSFGNTVLNASSSYTQLQVGLNAGVSSRPS